MKQTVSHYMMTDDRIQDIQEILDRLGLDGIENLIYGRVPAARPAEEITVGCHLAYWPVWMDFYLGNKEGLAEDFPIKESIIENFGGETAEDWLEMIRDNIHAALAEKPEYLVWHTAHCRNREIWTHKFHYTSREVLEKTAEVYNRVSDAVPSSVWVLFENTFWPGLYKLDPAEVDYFFSLISRNNVGIMLDTSHLMAANPDLTSEAEGAEYICSVVKRLGSMKSLIKGIHLSCSLSGEYQRRVAGKIPDVVNVETIRHHIISMDQHRPFATDAAKRIVDCIEPLYVTHELFADDFSIPLDKVQLQRRAMGKF